MLKTLFDYQGLPRFCQTQSKHIGLGLKGRWLTDLALRTLFGMCMCAGQNLSRSDKPAGYHFTDFSKVVKAASFCFTAAAGPVILMNKASVGPNLIIATVMALFSGSGPTIL